MIHPLVKIITVDGFYTNQQATQLWNTVYDLPFIQQEFGKQIDQFNMIADDADNMFSGILNSHMAVVHEQSGIFRLPQRFIHFEEFTDTNEWIFAVALQPSVFDIFEHSSGAKTALDDYKFNYRNLFEWEHKINYQLDPGCGVLFRPWLFHSFDSGMLQIFRLREKE